MLDGIFLHISATLRSFFFRPSQRSRSSRHRISRLRQKPDSTRIRVILQFFREYFIVKQYQDVNLLSQLRILLSSKICQLETDNFLNSQHQMQVSHVSIKVRSKYVLCPAGSTCCCTRSAAGKPVFRCGKICSAANGSTFCGTPSFTRNDVSGKLLTQLFW